MAGPFSATRSERTAPPPLVPLGYGLGAAGMALVLLALVSGRSLAALFIACGLTVVVTATIAPRPYRVAAFAAVMLTPFLAVAGFLRPTEYNASFYVAAFVLALCAVGLFQARAVPTTFGTAYLLYIVVAGVVYFLLRGDPASISGMAAVLMAFGAYVLVRRATRVERRVLLGALLAMASVEAVLGMAQSLFGWPSFPLVLEQLIVSPRNYFAYIVPGVSAEVVQGSGTFSHFNGLGAVLALAVPVGFGWWLERLRSPLRLAAFAVLAGGVLTTYSRGALAGALAGCLFVLILQRHHSRRVLALLVACVAVIAALLALSTATQYYEATGNVGVRVETWRIAAGDALRAPSNLAFGYGFSHFHQSVLSGSSGDVARRSGTMSSLHSGPLQLLLEFGLLGVALFVLWLVSAFRTGLGPRRTPLAVAFLGGVVAFLCHQAVDTSFFAFPGVLLAVALALAEAECDPGQGSITVAPAGSRDSPPA